MIHIQINFYWLMMMMIVGKKYPKQIDQKERHLQRSTVLMGQKRKQTCAKKQKSGLQCFNCSEAFTRKDNLNPHVKNKHTWN